MSANSGLTGVRPPGYRLPDAAHVGRVKLQVSDLARSLDYYQRVIGLHAKDTSATHAILGPHDDDRVLVELHEKKGVRAVPRRGLLGLYHFAILLPDQPALGRFLLNLAELGEQPGMSDHLVSEAIYLQDPDNLGIEVYRDRPRKAWRIMDGQLEMASNPLDVRSVLASAAGERWAGAPKGTTMGHVHLHVGDIEQAGKFYHEGLGLDKVVWNYPGALFMSAGGYHHHLGTNTWARGAASASEDDARLLEWELVVPTASDVDGAEESLTRSASKVTRDAGDAIVADPWGTKLRIGTGN
ncbi:MAG TPA: VOC family protein [Gemmatimonadaceae bacterium]